MSTVNAALKIWAEKNDIPLAEAKDVRLICQSPPVSKLDNSLNNLKECERLSLSTNQIDRLIPLGGMKGLKILSLGRNNLKRIEKLEEVADTLEEFWVSYNQIASLDGLSSLNNLRVLYMSNNLIRDWSELSKLAALPNLRDVLFVGNPIYEGMDPEDAMIEVIKKLPQVTKVDGKLVTPTMKEKAEA
eukprot:TRINITY_DN34517_c1_g1_i1.p1 TRINITY_DN34517_c1_g1~~TRINITY_DN34517_c1_g1_i1.p1  ORF type:complete len:188 (-),score=56.35 TRINITY_DN34517_c1_g1_i1:165-728(-)